MNGTDLEFLVLRLEEPYPHYLFLLGSKGTPLGSWSLVNPPPEEGGVKRLAIEVGDEEPPRGVLFEEGSIAEGVEVWDRGRGEALSLRAAKLELLLSGLRLRGRYLALVPTWGRNTARRLWVLFKIPPRREKRKGRPID